MVSWFSGRNSAKNTQNPLLLIEKAMLHSPPTAALAQQPVSNVPMRQGILHFFAYFPLYLAFSAILVLGISYLLPYSMDEFSQFSPITCLYYPYNKLNIFREACGQYDLKFVFPFLGERTLPLRAFSYVGSLQALLYFPIFLIWKSPLSARLLGMFWLVAEAHVLALLFPAVRRRWIFFGLVGFFFYFLMHVVDRGPIGPQFFFIFLSYWLLCRWATTLHLRYIVWLAFIMVMGLWLKPTYVGPAVGVFIVGVVYIGGRFRALFLTPKFLYRFLIQFAAGLLAFGVFWSVIFLGKTAKGGAYYLIFKQGAVFSLADILQGSIFSGHSWGMLWNMWQANALGRWEPVPQPTITSVSYTLVTLLVVPALMAGLFTSRRLTLRQMVEPAIFYVTFLFVLGTVLLSKAAWAVHHLMLAFPFLILSFLSLFDICRRVLGRIWAGWYVAGCALLAVNGIAFATYFAQPIRPNDSFARQVVHHVLYSPDLSSRYIYVIVDFGMYFYQGLYGNRDQSVLFILPLNSEEHIAKLRQISAAQGRKLLFVHRTGWSETNRELIASSFDLYRCNAIPENATWQILLEDDDMDSPCTEGRAVPAPAERSLPTILW